MTVKYGMSIGAGDESLDELRQQHDRHEMVDDEIQDIEGRGPEREIHPDADEEVKQRGPEALGVANIPPVQKGQTRREQDAASEQLDPVQPESSLRHHAEHETNAAVLEADQVEVPNRRIDLFERQELAGNDQKEVADTQLPGDVGDLPRLGSVVDVGRRGGKQLGINSRP